MSRSIPPASRRSSDDHEAVFTYRDASVGLEVHVAIHSTRLGPAVGGTRWLTYGDSNIALADAKRLSRAMSYKCAFAGLPCGGGKAVIRASDAGKSGNALASYGSFLNRIGDLFATGEDVGFSLPDCERLREWTQFVAGTSSSGNGDPSEHTAIGVFHSILALSNRIWPADSALAGRRIAVQGLGGVGRKLARLLSEAGAELVVADLDAEAVARVVADHGAVVTATETIHRADVDILAPCALGGIVSEATVDEIQAKAVVGAANNQLTDPGLANRLSVRGVVWAPDFVVNAGGVVGAAEEISRIPGRRAPPIEDVARRLEAIGERTGSLYDEACREGLTMLTVAMRNAERLLRPATVRENAQCT